MRVRKESIVAAVFIAGLVAATSPAWRVLLLGRNPTLDELLQLRCLGGRVKVDATPVVQPAERVVGYRALDIR